MSDICQRLVDLRENLGINQSKFASELDIKRPTLAGYEKGTFPPSTDFLIKIREIHNVSIDWVLTGNGDMFLTSGVSALQSVGRDILPHGGKIPILSQRVSCGPGQEWHSGENIEKYVDITDLFPLVGKKKELFGFPVRGGSMEGAGIMDGDIVLVTPIYSDFLGSNYYIYSYDDSVYLKYIVESDEGYISYSILPGGEQRKKHEVNFHDEYQRMQILGVVVAWLHENKLIRR